MRQKGLEKGVNTLNFPKKSKGLIRSLNRKGVRDDRSPQVVEKTAQPEEPTVCARCGAVFLRKTWRHDHTLTEDLLERRRWGFCPACEQLGRQEAQGRLLLCGTGINERRATIIRRIQNVARRASHTQPQRRIVSIDTIDEDGNVLEVMTTSQKLAHRIAHELKKLFGGRTSYAWSDDGTLFATWNLEKAKPKKKKSK